MRVIEMVPWVTKSIRMIARVAKATLMISQPSTSGHDDSIPCKQGHHDDDMILLKIIMMVLWVTVDCKVNCHKPCKSDCEVTMVSCKRLWCTHTIKMLAAMAFAKCNLWKAIIKDYTTCRPTSKKSWPFSTTTASCNVIHQHIWACQRLKNQPILIFTLESKVVPTHHFNFLSWKKITKNWWKSMML